MRPFLLVLPMLAGLLHASAPPAVEVATLGTSEDRELARRIADSSIGLPTPALTAFALPIRNHLNRSFFPRRQESSVWISKALGPRLRGDDRLDRCFPDAAPRGVTFASARNELAFADFLVPKLYRVALDAPMTTAEAAI
jgi:hypothetical protein